jgi:serine/threonine protein kinase
MQEDRVIRKRNARAQVLKRKYGKEADIWSCGVILYILLSGVPPFWGETEQQIFESVAKSHIDFQTDPWPHISEEAKGCVRAMLQQACLSKLKPPDTEFSQSQAFAMLKDPPLLLCE